MPMFFFAEKGKIDIEFEGHAEAGASTNYTFASQPFGAADDARYVVACLAWQGGTTFRNPTSVTIGGITATQLVSGNNTTAGIIRGAAIYIAKVQTGTTGDVVLNMDGACQSAGCSTYKVLGILAPAAASIATSAANNPTATLDIAANGGLIAVAIARQSPTPTSTWTNATEDCDTALEGDGLNSMSSAHDTNENVVSSLEVTDTFSSTVGSFGAFATFEP